MARLLEYQGKELLKKSKIKVPRGEVVESMERAVAAALEIGFPVMVKAQVFRGGRGKAGGIHKAEDMTSLDKICRTLLGNEVGGLKVEKLLVEEKLDIKKEVYLAITGDPQTRKPVLIFSETGGVDIEEVARNNPEKVVSQTIDILEGLYDYQARNAIRKCPGLDGREMVKCAEAATGLFLVYRGYDCKLVEINPMVITTGGELLAADARVDVDDDAVWRHPELGLTAAEEAGDRPSTLLEMEAGCIDEGDHRGSAHFVQIDPDGAYAEETGKISIGFNTVGTGCGLTLLDEIVPLGYYPVNFCDTSGNPTSLKMYAATRIIFSQPGINGYIFVTGVAAQLLDNTARGIIKALLELYPGTGGQPNIPCVFVFRGRSDEVALQLFEEHGISKSPMVKMMGRWATEKDAARAFDELYRKFQPVGKE